MRSKGFLLETFLKRFLISFLCFVFFTLNARPAQIEIRVEYSKSADIFEFLDNVSNWWPGFTEEEYVKHWNRSVKSEPNDKGLFVKCARLREKYYNDPDQKEKDPLKNKNGFFSNSGSLDADPFADAFYSSNSLEEAFQKLEKLLSTQDMEFVKMFYEHFRSRSESLIVNDGKDFSGSIKLVNEKLKTSEITRYFEGVTKFYKVESGFKYRVLYTWWPPISRTNASPTGRYLIMRNHPIKHKDRDDSDIVAHEIIHTISTGQSVAQKLKLTQEFLKSCPVQDKLKKLLILEEPMAVVFGQLIFVQKFNPNHFSTSENLYNNPWINTFSRLIFEPLKSRFEKGETINDGFIRDASKICVDLLAVMPLMNK
jgi:hypothetical protein